MITLIIALDVTDPRDMDAWAFITKHATDIDVRKCVRRAFSNWYATPEGKGYVERDGANWGDALQIPDEFLQAHEIEYLREAFPPSNASMGSVDRDLLCNGYDRKLVVEHGEWLIVP